ncbi:PI-PLC domain-containing protein [Marinigracilibium pacificum]|uniref:1-phosphatidylinositol phosphodiesterase n=1 Tax=Marinigracilibium pacificum TaxID=2729599 RepID=A0A848J4L9_9BACT|nr:hypothetical protein [Marinigracilibium pacificum]NMM50666.1 hypothetical protein [Marinigracilibium pacificum]
MGKTTVKSTTKSTTYPNWMQDNISLLGNKRLADICITGSHDSGMYKRTVGGTFGALDCNTLTQKYGVADQLQYGARYFDIRPCIATGGSYYTGHYSETGGLWLGANGESITDIISDINIFTESSDELIILNLSHAKNTNDGYRDLNQSEWDALFEILKVNLKCLFSIPGDLPDLVMNQTLNTFIGNGSAAVVVIVEANGIDLGSYANQGFYPYESLNAINKYSNTDSLGKMISDQVEKMNLYANDYFLLSWTLTQDAKDAVLCKTGLADSIIDLAKKAAKGLPKLMPYVTANNKPNILYMDNIGYRDYVSVVMEINNI